VIEAMQVLILLYGQDLSKLSDFDSSELTNRIFIIYLRVFINFTIGMLQNDEREVKFLVKA